jgi:hypothetical protein
MTTEWVSGGGNHFHHHRFTKMGFLCRISIWLSGNKKYFKITKNIAIFLYDHKIGFRWRKPILSPRFHEKCVSGCGNPFCKQETRNIFEFEYNLTLFLMRTRHACVDKERNGFYHSFGRGHFQYEPRASGYWLDWTGLGGLGVMGHWVL